MKKNMIWPIVIIAVAIYIIISIFADFEELLSVLGDFNWSFLLLLILLALIAYLIRFIKWSYFLKKASVKIGLKENLFVFFSGLTMIITPGKLGEIWKGWLIKDINQEKLGKTIPVVIVDRITDVLGLVLLSLLGIFYYKEGTLLILIILILVLVFIFLVRSKRMWKKIVKLLEKRARKYSVDAKTMHISFKKIIKPNRLMAMSLLSAFAWFLECLGLFLIVQGFGESIGIMEATFIFSFATLAGAISMIPGGLGVAETTIIGLLQVFGLSLSISVGVSLIVRFGTLWFGAIVGLSVYLIFKKKIMKTKRIKLKVNNG